MQTIFLEFRHENGALAANGTDVTFFIDGRWSSHTKFEKIYERVAQLRSSAAVGRKYRNQLFVGYSVSQSNATCAMTDRNKPEWAAIKHKAGQSVGRDGRFGSR